MTNMGLVLEVVLYIRTRLIQLSVTCLIWNAVFASDE